MGHHHGADSEPIDSLLGEALENPGEHLLPSVELQSLDGNSVLLSPCQTDEADDAAATIGVDHSSKRFGVECVFGDFHVDTAAAGHALGP